MRQSSTVPVALQAEPARPSGPASYHVGDPIPPALGPGELRRILNIPEATFYAYQKNGLFKRFEFRRPIGAKRYSGALVKRYLEQG